MNKKGGLLSFMIGLLSIPIYISLFLALITQRQNIEAEGILAENAQRLMMLEQEHQRVNMFLDQAAYLSSQEAFETIKDVENCDSYAGVPYWRGKESKETFGYCIGGAEELVRQSMQDGFVDYLQKYPVDSTSIPRTYDILFDSQDELHIIGTPLAPMRIGEEGMQMVAYPGFRVSIPNHLNEVKELEDLVDGIVDDCIGQELEGCVDSYIERANRQAVLPEEKIAVSYGRSCTSEDKKGDRSIVLCKETSFGKLGFALYIGLDIPLEIIKLEVARESATQNWLKKGQNFIVNAGDEVIVSGTVTAPQDVIISWCVKGLACVPVDDSGTPTKRHFSFTFEPQEYAKEHWLQVEMGLDLITSPTNLLMTT